MTKGPRPISVRADYPKASGVPFTRACFALVQRHALQRDHEDIDSFIPYDDPVAKEIVARAVAGAGSATGSGWAAELAQQSFGAYLNDLAPHSGAARLIALATPAVTTNPEDTTKYPTRVGPTAPGFVAENSPMALSNYAFDAVQIGPAKKMGVIVPFTRELAKRSDAERIFAQMLREDLAAGLDTALFSTSAATSAAPAGLLYGVTAGTGIPGADGAAMKQDLIDLAASVADGGSGNVTFVMAPKRLAKLRILDPVLAASLDVAASAAVPADRIIAADAAALLVATDPAPEIDASNAATLHMSSVPLEIVSLTGPTTADPVRSLWQTASTAFRLLHDLAFAKRRATCVAYTDAVTW
ncbi:phage major capsid protein [Bradyrhizobium sp. NBAIM03]|uniref:phage major capsid protein n=1 Tax=Bradyrhizobium sp. NBAIM03 TaxID=2793816 RepID=UPI001CD46B1E|nr:phage major capsid protein [Bradyrhizobium sp. NBAIM03]MCA1531436.1 phage major capsid protein [Bradyrhizobium sp. NBAIM03]